MNKNLFTQVLNKKPSKNIFDLTHDVKLSTKMGRLTPVMIMECVPGDKFNISAENIIRYAPLISPVMHRMDVTLHYFFVPNRLSWPNWEKFITGSQLETPAGPGVDPTPPFLSLDNPRTLQGTLANYLGVPEVQPGDTVEVNALPFAAYQRVYNEYYRDQNLITEVADDLVDGLNSTNLTFLRNRAWEHDYFTSALPWSQKGEAVDIPLAPMEDVPVYVEPEASYSIGVRVTNNNAPVGDPEVYIGPKDPNWTPPLEPTQLWAETSGLNAQPTTINELRRAFKLQEWLEKNARAGTRYIESILAHFGVRSSDKRLQRPEYITGVKTPVMVSEVLNTTGETLPQGNMAGHAIAVTTGKAGSYYCEEHGYIIGIMSVLPKTAYQQGVPKHFLKFDRLDYFWPTFAHLGEQEIVNREIYVNHTDPDGTFGYTPRYAEYKYMPSRVAGEFQTTLNYWHLGRIFSSQPSLNGAFVTSDPTDRVFAVNDGSDNLYCQVLNKVMAVRPMPFFGTPSF